MIMLREEDGRMLSLCGDGEARGHWADVSSLVTATQILCPLFFLTDPWEKENGRVRGAESLSEKKANRERSVSNQHRWTQRQRVIYPSVTHTQHECHQRAGDSRTSYNDGAAFATTLRWNLLNNSGETFSLEEVLLWIMGWYFGQKQWFTVKTH